MNSSLLPSMLNAGHIRNTDFSSELRFTTSRSGGKGGQHVNKVSTKVELHFDYLSSNILNDEQKTLISQKLGSFINKEGILNVIAQEDRSQLTNKKRAVDKFYTLLERAFKKTKKRIATKPGKAYHKKRLTAKRKHAEKKKIRSPWKGEE
jgi:ribosome-associated protein